MGAVCRSGRAVRADDGIIQQAGGYGSSSPLYVFFILVMAFLVNLPTAKGNVSDLVSEAEEGVSPPVNEL